MKRWIPFILSLLLASCAGTGEAIIDKANTVRDAARQAADVVEDSRCHNRPIGVLADMMERRGVEWATGYLLSCPNTQAIVEAARKSPTVGVSRLLLSPRQRTRQNRPRP